eukprot:493198_1
MEWNGVIFPQTGYYKGGIFRFKILFEDHRPMACPKVIFQTNLFHPLVDPVTKQLNLNGSPLCGNKRIHIADILTHIQSILVDDIKYWHNSLFIFNKDCFKLYIDYMKQPTSKTNNHPFISKVNQCVQSSVLHKDKDIDKNKNALLLSDAHVDPHDG